MTATPATITLIGCGRMGGALLRGWLAAGTVGHVDILEPYGAIRQDKVAVFTDAQSLFDNARLPDAVVLAVKPQVMAEVCTALKPFIPPRALVLSIAAGKTLGSFEALFGATQPLIRAMPNTPAAIGQGITAAVPNAAVTPAQRALAEELLRAGGAVEWLADESLMDAVTALSGSGPAYIFYLMETLAAAGVECGLPAPLSMALARQTVIGSAALAAADANTDAATLRENVTSPGGTTAAALEVLMNGEVQEIYNRALRAATVRGKALSAD